MGSHRFWKASKRVWLLTIAVAPWTPVCLAIEQDTPERTLVADLISLRRQPDEGVIFAERARKALEAYGAAEVAGPGRASERIERVRQALRDERALTECERRHFEEVAASAGPALDAAALGQLLLKLFDPGQALYRSPLMSGLGHGVFVFCGDDAKAVAPEALAQRFAPALWFSYDEPLVLERVTVPRALPGDPQGDGRGPVVYYQVTSGMLLGGRKGPWSGKGAGREDTVDLSGGRARALKIRYFFYYPRDTGTNGHPHDVEGAEVFLDVIDWPWGNAPGQDRCVRVVPKRVRGLAHGLMWAANNLLLEGGAACDTAFPFTLLVEEGKHASCPDRNGDGLYTPGYDVNYWVNEAWGLRDDFGAARVHSRYLPESAKPRKRPNLIVPPLALEDAPRQLALKQLYCERTSTPTAPVEARRGEARTQGEDPGTATVPPTCVSGWEEHSYELRGAVGFWSSQRKQLDPFLRGKLTEQEFGELWPGRRTFYNRGLREFAGLEITREDGDVLLLPQVTPFVRGLPLVDGWLTLEPGVALKGKSAFRRLGLTYSRSASRPLDWYVTLNFRDFASWDADWRGWWPRLRVRTRPEFGFKLRFQVDQVFGRVPLLNQLRRLHPLWHSFIGIRLGVEAVPGGGSGHTFRGRWSLGTAAW